MPKLPLRPLVRPATLLPALALILLMVNTTPASAVVAAPEVTSSSATHNLVTLAWTPVSGAAAYRIRWSTTTKMIDFNFHVASGSTAQVTGLAADTGYYFKVKALTSSGSTLTDYSALVAVRTTVTPPPPPVTTLRVGSYNVACEKCTDTPEGEEGTWYERRAAVVSTIKGEDLDVLGVQEASQGQLAQVPGTSQFDDLVQRLGSPWAITNAYRYNCVRSTSASSCEAQDRGASQGTRIFYNSSRITLTAQGSKLLPSVAGENERYMAWAILRQTTTGKSFFFVSQHLESGSAYDTLRRQEAETALAVVRAKNTTNLPVIAVGDLNSTRFNPGANYPYDVWVRGGLVDPLGGAYRTTTTAPGATVERAINRRVSSWNDFQRKVRVASSTWVNGSNLDYILTSRMRVSEWKTVVAMDAAGNFIGRIPSDHNMIRATVHLP